MAFNIISYCNSYLPPEYFLHGVVDEKTDVYAYGVLLLEIITGRPALDSSQKSLVMWVSCFYLPSLTDWCTELVFPFETKAVSNNLLQAKPLLTNNCIDELVDPRVADSYDSEQMKLVATVSDMCLHQCPIQRPQMSQACIHNSKP